MERVRQGRLELGTVLAERYRILRPLARGGMATVYLGRQLGLDRRVAVKVLTPGQANHVEVADLFRREAQAIKHLSHPNTVRLYDFGETEGGLLYLVLEYLQGDGLDAVLRMRGALPYRTVVHVGIQVLKSLIEAHARGIVHRDIKPSNVMLCQQLGEPDFVKVLDFGIARISRTGVAPLPDRPGEVMGTPRYMSPEQLLGDEVDARSDLYSLGLLLSELATGHPIYSSNQLDKVLAERSRRRTVEPVGWLRRTRLGLVLARALATEPDRRYGAAGDMLEALIAAPDRRSDTTPAPVPVAPLESAPPASRGEDTADHAAIVSVAKSPGGWLPSYEPLALDPTLPRVPGRPLKPRQSMFSRPDPDDAITAPDTPRPHGRSRPRLGPPDELVAGRDVSALVARRIARLVWRRTIWAALVGAAAATAATVAITSLFF